MTVVLDPKLSLEEVEKELLARRQEDPLANVYHPGTEQQFQVHRSRKPITLIVGGNRSGKSYCSVAESQYYATGRRVYAETPEPCEIWYIVPSMPMFRRAIQPIFRKLVPQLEI